MSDLLCKLEHVKNELFHFYSVRFVWFANLAGGINMRNLLFCNVMMQHSFLITSKIDGKSNYSNYSTDGKTSSAKPT